MENKKPITLSINDCKKEIFKILNDSNLHPCILEYVIKDILNEVHSLVDYYTSKEKTEYDKTIQESNE